MALYVPDEGAAAVLEVLFNNTRAAGGNDLTLKLFCNDVTLSDSDTSSTFTEASGGGYLAITLTTGGWSVSNTDDIEVATYPKQTFTFTGALDTNPTIYGYFVVDDDDTLWFAEKFDTPVVPVSSGNYINITPKYQASKGTPS